MTHPHPHPQSQIVLPALPSSARSQIPPGYGCLVAIFNRGPYLWTAMKTHRLYISSQRVHALFGEGVWYIPVLPGHHGVHLADVMGLPKIKTSVNVPPDPSQAPTLSFRFGWRNRVFDGNGTDVTRFGMWSSYLIGLVMFGVLGAICVLGCIGIFVFPELTGRILANLL